MSLNVVAKRYAEALFQIGEENKNLDKLVQQFTQLNEILKDNEQILTYMNHPKVSEAEKLSFIDKAFSQFENVVKNTLKLLVKRQRFDLTSLIIQQFIAIVNDVEQVAEVTR